MRNRSPRSVIAPLAGFAVALSTLAAVAGPAEANVDPAIDTFPYSQDWSNGTLIDTNDDWSGVQGVQGYLGDDGSHTTAGIDPQTVLADASATTDVVANAAVTTTAGGVLEVNGNTIAMQGSGSADAPNLVFHLDLSGKAGATFAFDALDLDAGGDDTNQQIAVHYRVGTSGDYTNLPAGYIADATTGGSASQVTHREVALPAAADGQADVFVRVMTTNAPSNDELTGIDNIEITADEASSEGLVISEVYGGGTGSGDPDTYGNDFIELENRSSAEINLEGWSVQYHSATGTGQFAVHALHGRIPAGKKYLIQEGNFATGTPLPTPEETGSLTMSLSNGVVALVSNTTPYPTFGTTTGVDLAGVTDNGLVDLVGYGSTPNTYETARTGTALSNTLSASRKATEDTDDNSADFTTGAPNPERCDCPLPLAASNQANVSVFKDDPIAPFTLQATGGTAPYHWTATGLPDGLSIADDGTVSGIPTDTGMFPVTATVTDSAATPDSDTVDFTITVELAPQLLTIAEIQGTGAASPVDGNIVITRGVVTARYPTGTGSMAGFVIQTGGEEGVDYTTPGASDAIFVFSGNKTAPAIGDSVEVKGEADERFGSTQINASTTGTITPLSTPQPPVVPNDVVPGTDCEIPNCPTAAELNVLREEYEHEAFQPTGDYTVTDAYDGSPFDGGFGMQGEIGLAAESDIPLMIPTETIDQSDTAAIAAHRAYNEAHKLVLDDAKSLDYTTNANEDTPFPWITPTHPVRVGAPVTFPVPVILKFDFGVWRVLPREEVAGGEDGQDLVAIENTREAAPDDVLGTEGDLKIATFNMLNYFNTFGEAWAASDHNSTGSPGTTYNFDNPRRCSYFSDRGPDGGGAGAIRITNDECTQDAVDPLTGLNVKLPGPRGAANEVSFLRQEAKLVNAINTIDADVMSLEEVENSIKLYDALIDGPDGVDKNRDDALARLVSKLNEAEPGRWALVESPRPEALPTIQEQDAIRSAFIYNPAAVEPVGRSQVLVNAPAFRNAREPLAQAFKPLGGGRDDAFLVIVNHFKSKGGPQAPAPPATGDNDDKGDGAGFYNGDRKRQAQALVAFANQVSSDKNIEPVFLTGDFNSYSAEDPVQVIEGAGFTNLKPANGQTSYNFGGLAGSLDHVFANGAAEAMVTGEDIWEINANESVYYEYSRYNANAAQLYDQSVFRSSDHNPEIIGIDVGELTPDPVRDTVQILATNDFHGRLVDDPGSAAAGAASMAGAVKQLRAENSSTLFTAAGDLIGASTFESFIQNDEPTIDALNEAGLEVSSVGNHEFDQGYHDLVDRVLPRAQWEYLGANVRMKDTGAPALPETWCDTLPNGKTVGFVGAVTEDLPTLVSQDALADVVVTDIVDSVNEHADVLKGPDGCGEPKGADLVVMLVHEGAATTSFSSVTDDSTFGQIVDGADANIDAIVSGHTHLAYNHKVTVDEWVTQGREVTQRPVVSAGQYGANLNRLQFEFEDDRLVNIRQTVLQLKDYAPDPNTQEIVDDAVEFADVAGSEILGDIEDKFARAGRIGDDGQIVESRGAESTLGNLIAEVQRWKTGADIGFMNPGGLRDDIEGSNGTPREVTYREAANAQPFANTLVTMDLTGAQIKDVLEEQWQRDADGNVPSRPFLRLGTSEGFTATYDPTKPEGDRVTGMFLDGEPLDPAATYKVSATSFLAGAGDNFWTLADGDNLQDTGQTDLQAVVDYLAEFAEHGSGDVLPVGYNQHQVGVKVGGTGPFVAGESVTLNLSSLVMTGIIGGEIVDDQDDQVRLMDGATELAVATVGDKELVNSLFDERGTATLTFDVPAGVDDGTTYFTLEGVQTGTEVPIGIPTSDGVVNGTVSGTDQTVEYGQAITIPVTVTPSDATGTVTLMQGATPLGSTELTAGAGSISLSAGALPVGEHHLTLVYSGDSTYGEATGTVTVTVTKQASSVTAACPSVTFGTAWSIKAIVTPSTASGSVEVRNGATLLGSGSLSGGRATIMVAGSALPVGTHTLTIRYVGDGAHAASETTCSITITGSVPSDDGTVTSLGSVSELVYGRGGSVTVTVTGGGGPLTGTVELREGDRLIGSAPVTGAAAGRDGRLAATVGTATIFIPPKALSVGTHTLTLRYLGDANNAPSQTTFTATVLKADVAVSAKVKPKRIVADRTRSRVMIEVTAPGLVVTGQVKVRWKDETRTVRLKDGKAVVQLGKWGSAGQKTVKVTYLGSATANGAASTVTFTVQRKRG